MDMISIGMRCNDKGVFAFRETLYKFVTDLVCFLWGYLTRLKTLANMVSYNVIFLTVPAG
jgi:hypothetical protein